ncbi:MAG: hypothetical protein ACR2NC_05245 [Thermodesulfobacteriota bacterium]
MKIKYYYILSIIIFVVGLIAFVNYVYSKYTSLNDLLVKFDMPGVVNLNIDKPGMYDLYFEDGLAQNSKLFDDENTRDSFRLTVKNDEGASMPFQRTEAIKKYNYRGRTGESVYEINLPRAGNYKFSGVINENRENKEFTLILDKGFSDTRSKTVVTAQAILLFPIVASLLLFLYAYSKSRL